MLFVVRDEHMACFYYNAHQVEHFLGSQRSALHAVMHAVSAELKWPVLLCDGVGIEMFAKLV